MPACRLSVILPDSARTDSTEAACAWPASAVLGEWDGRTAELVVRRAGQEGRKEEARLARRRTEEQADWGEQPRKKGRKEGESGCLGSSRRNTVTLLERTRTNPMSKIVLVEHAQGRGIEVGAAPEDA